MSSNTVIGVSDKETKIVSGGSETINVFKLLEEVIKSTSAAVKKQLNTGTTKAVGTVKATKAVKAVIG